MFKGVEHCQNLYRILSKELNNYLIIIYRFPVCDLAELPLD